MAGEIEAIQDRMQIFNDDTADRRAFAAACANGYINGLPMGPGTVDAVLAVLGRTKSVADGITEVEAESGEVFGPDVGRHPGRITEA